MQNLHCPNAEVSGRSAKKRSNSLWESETLSPGDRLHHSYSSGPSTELKRRKLDQTDTTEMERALSDRPDRAMGIQYPTPPCTPLTSDLEDPDHRARLTSPVYTRASHTRTDFEFPSQLSQQTIQRNYEEFEKIALRKLIDEPCDLSFEKSTVGDSEAEAWHSSGLEGLSDEINDMEPER